MEQSLYHVKSCIWKVNSNSQEAIEGFSEEMTPEENWGLRRREVDEENKKGQPRQNKRQWQEEMWGIQGSGKGPVRLRQIVEGQHMCLPPQSPALLSQMKVKVKGVCVCVYWSTADLQCSVNFRCAAKWFSYIRFFAIIGYYKILSLIPHIIQ